MLKDSHGIPAPRIDYKIGENTARMMEHGVARAKEILAAAEATDICVNSPILYGGWHLLGTARMGADPALSAALKQPGKGLTSCPGCCIAPPASRYPDGVYAHIVGIVTEFNPPHRGQILAPQHVVHRAVTGVCNKYAVGKRDIRNALRLAQTGDETVAAAFSRVPA